MPHKDLEYDPVQRKCFAGGYISRCVDRSRQGYLARTTASVVFGNRILEFYCSKAFKRAEWYTSGAAPWVVGVKLSR